MVTFKVKDLTGQRFGSRVVIGPYRIRGTRRGAYWWCRCDCGLECWVRSDIIQKHGECSECSLVTRAEGNRLQLGLTYYHKLISQAHGRDIVFQVSFDYLMELWEAQKHKCALSGVLLIISKTWGIEHTASVDRIDSSRGYVEGNVQWVHKILNWMKKDLPNAEFIEWCKQVARWQEGGV